MASDELEKTSKLAKNSKISEVGKINSELYKYAPEEFKLRLQQFLNNRYTKNCIPNEWRYAIVTPIFKKVTEETKKYRGFCILNTCYKLHSKSLIG